MQIKETRVGDCIHWEFIYSDEEYDWIDAFNAAQGSEYKLQRPEKKENGKLGTLG